MSLRAFRWQMLRRPAVATPYISPLAGAWATKVQPSTGSSRGSGRRIATTTAAATQPSEKTLPLSSGGLVSVSSPEPGPGADGSHTSDEASQAGKAKLKDARPFSDFLTDTFQRQHDYLRISLTERCNLRCLYCMPEEGVELSPAQNLLTTPEVVLLANVFVAQGVNKIRLTGGEPTVRRDILPLMRQLGELRRLGLRELCLTTNGLALHRKLEAMVEAGLTGVNLSLDTLDPLQFRLMTRRDGFEAVRRSMDRILSLNKAGAGVRLKINCVVMRGLNDGEMADFVALTRDHDLEVRFIEYMPFDGNRWSTGKMVSFNEMLERIGRHYPTLRRTTPNAHHNGPHDTSKTYEVPGFAGRVGFITSMTHNFCGGCNRLRITSDGSLKVCLFGNAEVSLRDILRRANGGEPIDEVALAGMIRLAKDATCVAAEQDPNLGIPLSDVIPNAPELLDIIGMAVKRKKAQHAGIGELEHMKNRPMILIDGNSRHRPQQLTDIGLVRSWRRPLNSGSHTPVLPPSLTSTLPVGMLSAFQSRGYSTKRSPSQVDGCGRKTPESLPPEPRLTHVSASGTAHMVSVADKSATTRTAAAACTIRFSSPVAAALIQANDMAKGDVLGVARIAGIMAAKRTADLIPLCHPLALSHVGVDLQVAEGQQSLKRDTGGSVLADYGYVAIRTTVRCEGKTGVEMEALTAASVAALTVFDMCKAVDKGMRIDGLRVVFKDGGKSGRWAEGEQSYDDE